MGAMALAAVAGICWGLGEVCTKSVLHTHKIGPLTALALRSTIALPIVWVAWWLAVRRLGLERRPALEALTTPEILKLVLGSGIAAGAFGMIAFYAALNLGEVSRVKPVAFTVAPVIAVLLGWFVLHEPITLQRAIAIVLVLGGVVLLVK